MKFKDFAKLQLFAEDPAVTDPKPADPQPTEPNPAEPKSGSNQEPIKTYSQADIDKMIADRFAEYEKNQAEAKRLSEMNAQEKADYEKEQLEKRVAELLKKDALAEMTKVARTMLSEKNINVSDDLLKMIVSDNADETKSAVGSFITLFQDAVSAAVKNALKGEVPKAGSTSGLTKEKIFSVKNRAERQKLINENMELFQ